MSNQKSQNKGIRAIAGLSGMLGTLLIVAVIVLCAVSMLPGVFGIQTYAVISGSMEPTIPTGSVVFVEETDVRELLKDDVIAYYSSVEGGGVVTHRVVTNNTEEENLVTKGDANEKEDPTPVPYDRFIGKVALTIPVLGNILTAFTSQSGKIMAVCIAALGAVLSMLGNYIKDKY